MIELTSEHIAWKNGFEAGVAYTLRHLGKNNFTNEDIGRLISSLERLRVWKTGEEWKDLIKRNTTII